MSFESSLVKREHPSSISHLSINFPHFLPAMNLPYRVLICVLLVLQVLVFSGIILSEKLIKDANQNQTDEAANSSLSNKVILDIPMKSFYVLLAVSLLLFLTSLIAFIMAPNLIILYFIIAGTVLDLILQVAAILAMSEWWHCLILTACASSTILVLVSLNNILSNLLYQSALDTYPSTSLNHRFSNCDLQDLSTFRRYTLDPQLAREQIMMHQARSNNRKSFLFVIPSDDPSSSYAHPTSEFVDC